jgi:sulfur carrier protein
LSGEAPGGSESAVGASASGPGSPGPAALGARASAPGSPGAAAAPAEVRVTVNGEASSLPSGTTVADLLAARGASGKPCAVEINREIVPRSRHAAHALRDGDAVEIVSFVGGG